MSSRDSGDVAASGAIPLRVPPEAEHATAGADERHVDVLAAAPEASRPRRAPRFFFLDGEPAVAPRASRAPSYAATALALAALLCVALVRSLWVRASLPIALAAATIALVVRRRAARATTPASRATRTPSRCVSYDGTCLALHAGAGAGSGEPLFAARAPFGVVLLASRARDRVVAAVTSRGGAFYVGATFDAAARKAHASLLARASTLAGDDGLDAAGPDGEPVQLAPGELAALVDALVADDPSCLGRLLLTDARGAPIVLDGFELRVEGHRFDLTAPLEWRAIVFQEAFGPAFAVYQGTWIRQGTAEVVLVSLLPLSATPAVTADEGGTPVALETERMGLRDLRLVQASPEPPPPSALRVGIDRVFMLPLRAALDRAPRPAQPTPRARA